MHTFYRRITIITIFAIVFAECINAQDVAYSQFYADLIYLNPALAGSSRCPRAATIYRNQWYGLGNAFNTFSASFDQYVDKLQGGIGFRVMRDALGDGALQFTGIDAMYAYTFNVSKNLSVKAGIQTSYKQRRLNREKLIFADMIDPVRGIVFGTNEIPGDLTANYIDFSSGVVGFTKKSYFGLAVHHLQHLGRDDGGGIYQFLPVKYTVHFGTTVAISKNGLLRKDLFLSPNVVFQQQSQYQQLSYGIYVIDRNMVGGLWLRQSIAPNLGMDCITMLIGFEINKIKLGYSYDITISKLRKNSYGAHELSLAVQFECRQKIKKFKAISCPDF